MRIAMPVVNGELATHFGHASQFLFIDTDAGAITGSQPATPPGHAPGVLPAWLKASGVDVVLTGGMGHRAQALFEQAGVRVICGIPAGDPTAVVNDFLANSLQTGENPCAH